MVSISCRSGYTFGGAVVFRRGGGSSGSFVFWRVSIDV